MTRKFGVIDRVDDVNWPLQRVCKADVSSVSHLSERMQCSIPRPQPRPHTLPTRIKLSIPLEQR